MHLALCTTSLLYAYAKHSAQLSHSLSQPLSCSAPAALTACIPHHHLFQVCFPFCHLRHSHLPLHACSYNAATNSSEVCFQFFARPRSECAWGGSRCCDTTFVKFKFYPRKSVLRYHPAAVPWASGCLKCVGVRVCRIAAPMPSPA